MSNVAIVAIAAGILAVSALFFVAANSGYDSRRHVNDAMEEAAPVKARIAEFHQRNKSLPGPSEAATLRQELRLKRARGVEWDAGTRMVVVTMDGEPYPGKRFGFVADVREGRLEWTCRPVDIASKYLPAACR